MPPLSETMVPGFLLGRLWRTEICVLVSLTEETESSEVIQEAETGAKFAHPLCYYAVHRPKAKHGVIIMQAITSVSAPERAMRVAVHEPMHSHRSFRCIRIARSGA